MDFFESQEEARRKTKVLIFYFALAIIGIIGSVYLSFLAIFFFYSTHDGARFSGPISFSWWQPEIFLAVSGATLILVLASSAGKMFMLRSGGHTVATSLGGRLISRGGAEGKETQLLNIVEEMAIASGMPVPAVYILEEKGINAFAAGYTINDAVISVSRGALESLSRDELQGVVAHEFSHILNGDMRINIRLMGLLFGILVLSIVGRIVVRSSGRSGGRGKDKGGAIVIFGLALWVIGSLGAFFARIIKSAVSRQREFLADAAAVQFTRNPSGIGGALKKILESSSHSVIENERATEVSHMFFADSANTFLSGMFATHPPLKERIKRLGVDLNNLGSSEVRKTSVVDERNEEMVGVSSFADNATSIVKGNDLHSQIGQLQDRNVSYAKDLIASIPVSLRDRLSEPVAAQAIIIAMLVYGDVKVDQEELTIISDLDSSVINEIKTIAGSIKELPLCNRLPLLDLALPAVKQLQAAQYAVFRKAVLELIGLSKQAKLFSSFDYAIAAILLHNLDTFFGLQRANLSQTLLLREVKDSVQVVFGIIIFFAKQSEQETLSAWKKVGDILGVELQALSSSLFEIEQFDNALTELRRLAPKEKKKLLKAAIEAILIDDLVQIEEAELLRAVAESLSCPIPPIFPDRA